MKLWKNVSAYVGKSKVKEMKGNFSFSFSFVEISTSVRTAGDSMVEFTVTLRYKSKEFTTCKCIVSL